MAEELGQAAAEAPEAQPLPLRHGVACGLLATSATLVAGFSLLVIARLAL